MDIKIQRLQSSDLPRFIQLVRLFEVVFEMKNFDIPSDHHLQKLLLQDGFYVFVALDESDNVVGGLTAYTLTQYYSTKPLVYIFDLAVRTDLQRKGIGTRLIEAINNYSREAGAEEVFVQADRSDGYALDFYRRTTAVEEEVVHFYYSLEGKG